MRILALLIVLVASSCDKDMPVMEPGKALCNHHKASGMALCDEIGTGNHMPSVPIDQTDAWAMLPPDSLEALLNYVNDLERGYKGKPLPFNLNVKQIREAFDNLQKRREH